MFFIKDDSVLNSKYIISVMPAKKTLEAELPDMIVEIYDSDPIVLDNATGMELIDFLDHINKPVLKIPNDGIEGQNVRI